MSRWTGRLSLGVFVLLLCVVPGGSTAWGAEAGYPTPGTSDYPDGGMRVFGELGREAALQCVAVDSIRGYAYFGTDTKPGRIVKVALGGGTAPPRRVCSIKLEEGEDKLTCAVMDAANGYAYFGTGTLPGHVVKIAVGVGDSPPVRVGAITLDSPDEAPSCAAIDPAHGYAYFGTPGTMAKVIKVALGTGSDLPRRASALQFGAGGGPLACADIDTDAGYAYFGASREPGLVLKVKLEDGDTTPSSAGGLLFPAGVNYPQCCAIDTVHGFGYFGTGESPGRVVKVNLGAGGAAPSWVDLVALGADEDYLHGAAIDPTKNQACFGTNTLGAPAKIVKVDLGVGAAPPTRLSALTLETGEEAISCACCLPSLGYAWYGTYTYPGRAIKVQLGTPPAAPVRAGAATLASGPHSVSCALFDPTTGHAYLGHANSPSVTKIFMGNNANTPVRIGSVDFPVLSDYEILSGVIDTAGGYAYFGSVRNPACVMKASLGAGSSLPVFCGSCVLPDEANLKCGVLDHNRGYVCFANDAGEIVKLSMGMGSFPPIYVCTTDLPDFDLQMAMNDPATRMAWFASGSGPGAVVKVDLGEGADPPVRIGSLDASEPNLNTCVFDPLHATAYCGTGTSPAKVAKIGSLSDGATLPTFDDSITLDTGDNNLMSAIMDGPSAWFGTFTGNPSRLIKVFLQPTLSPHMWRVGSLTLPVGEERVRACVMDPTSGLGLIVVNSEPANVVKVALSQKAFVKATSCTLTEPAIATEVRWYSHRSEGNVRLAIYDNNSPRALLWESASLPNVMTNGFVAAPIASGTPSTLDLHPGTYWLAWQVDTTANVASHTGGAAGDGFFLLQPYGAFPTAIAAAQTSSTDEIWTQYLACDQAAMLRETVDETFSTDVTNPVPGAKDGWTPFSAYQVGQATDYDATNTALRVTISSGTGQPRINGWMTGNSEWYPCSLVGSDHYVRGKFYMFRGGQIDPGNLNQVPNMRLRLSTRFAVSSILEIFNHLSGDPGGTDLGHEIVPSSDSAHPSIYRVDFDPVDVPALGSSEEGISRGFEAYSLEDQENGSIELAESVIGVYPAWVLPNSGPEVRQEAVYQCSASDAGALRVFNSATDGPFLRKFALTAPGVPGAELPLDGVTDPIYSEGSGGIAMHSNKVTSSIVAIAVREFTELGANTGRVRVERDRQYKLRFHVKSSAASNTNSQMRLRARSLKFMWSQKLEVGGAYGAGSANNLIAQQALPGIGCQNPDQLIPNEAGGWYTVLLNTPISHDIQADQPKIEDQPGPGEAGASPRDVKFGFDLIDTLSGSSSSHREAGDFVLDRVDMRVYDLAAD